MEFFQKKINLIENCEKIDKQTCNKCQKIDTSSRATKTEHLRSRQNVLSVSPKWRPNREMAATRGIPRETRIISVLLRQKFTLTFA